MFTFKRAQRWNWSIRQRLRRLLAPPRSTTKPPRYRRYLSGKSEHAEPYLQAAREYVAEHPEQDRGWLYRKPFDANPGNSAFFDDMYGIMNLLGAMRVTPNGRILEVGSGPGWVTEILVALGFEIDAIEPSEDMISIARERLDSSQRHHHLGDARRVEFHAEPLEECSLPSESFDAVLFHAVLHHLVDEQKGLAQCFRLLRPGGVLGVSEGAWIPGDRVLEEAIDAEMQRFGTLENPYTVEYLDFLLRRQGFVDIRRYFRINGFFPAEMARRRIATLAVARPWDGNNLTARKPSPYAATTLDWAERTEAAIEVLSSTLDRASGLARLRVRLVNRGKTTWLARSPRAGAVTVALRRSEPDTPSFEEAGPRHCLPHDVVPDGKVDLTLDFRLPTMAGEDPWILDLVNEHLFWFSTRGTKAVVVHWD